MEELINKLKEFKAADDSAKEMEETIKEAIEKLEDYDLEIKLMRVIIEHFTNKREGENMSEEEKKAIKKLKQTSKQCHNSRECWDNKICDDCYVEVEDIIAIDKVLNLIEKQQGQLQEKDKIINIITGTLQQVLVNDEFFKKCLWNRICKFKQDENYDCTNELCDECVIEYFTKKAREV